MEFHHNNRKGTKKTKMCDWLGKFLSITVWGGGRPVDNCSALPLG